MRCFACSSPAAGRSSCCIARTRGTTGSTCCSQWGSFRARPSSTATGWERRPNGGGAHRQTTLNPVTRCYGRAGVHRLFGRFERVSLRKREFYLYLIPKLGRLYRRWQIRRYGTHPGGILVYGEPWPIWSPIEARLGRVMGWAWFIAAHKPG